ncbi:MAG TPA: tetratricopeptide repeat protein [Candidatus Sulfotelmatobacter sp.]|nr:tetratricopeptide repeat protein [Candidatus Sulfotelmatobacter sp.]
MKRLLAAASALLVVVFAGPLLAQSPDIASLISKAQAGDAKSQYDLAAVYMEGNGVAKDTAQGLKWLRKSADQGYVGAEATLGYMYQNGIATEKDVQQAAAWYRKAARQQNAKAQAHLSEMLSQGLISTREAEWRTPEPVKKSTPAPSDQKSVSFSLAEIEAGLTGGITPKRMSTLVSTYGVSFDLNAAARKRLASDGADDALLATISGSKRPL